MTTPVEKIHSRESEYVERKATHRRSEAIRASDDFEVIIVKTDKKFKKEIQRIYDTYSVDPPKKNPEAYFRCTIL